MKTILLNLYCSIENATTRFYKKRLSFHVTGPAHMSIQMGTLKSKDFSAVLTKWSLDGNFDEVKLLPVAEPLGEWKISVCSVACDAYVYSIPYSNTL